MQKTILYKGQDCKSRAFFWQRLVWGAALLGLLAPGLPALADSDGEVAVGGEHILTIRFAAGGMSVKERADAVTDRLVTILSDPDLKPADIVAVPMTRDEAKIVVNDELLVTVDAQTARFNQTKPLTLAQMWTEHLRKVLPRVNAKPNPNSIREGREMKDTNGKNK